MNINVNKPVLYVEPNYLGSERADGFGVENSDIITYQMPLEDYCIYVDLRVEVYGRGMGTATNPNRKTYILQWRSSEDKNEVSFLSGSEIHLQGNSGDSVNYLTTRYTNTYLYDLDGGQTNELFGISSIDIKYNQYFVPEVTIQFVDVRGGDLFAVSQRAHQAEKDGIGGYRDADIADSFFNCFFMTPYPQFEIIIKGFYGEPVNYKLNCTGFRTTFNSETGNLNVVATFMGYAFSFLGDVSFNAIMSAPYADCGGIEYWKARSEQIDEDFFLFGQNGDRVKIPTLAEFLVSLDNVEEKMKAQLDTSPAVQKQSELEDKKASYGELASKNEAYISAWKTAFPTEKGYIHIGGANKDLIILSKKSLDDDERYRVQDTDETKAIETAHNDVVACANSLGIDTRYKEDFKVTNIVTSKFLKYDKGKKEYSQTGKAKEYSNGDPNHDMTEDLDAELRTNKEIKEGNYVDGYYIRNYSVEYSEDITKKTNEIEGDINTNMAAVETANADALTNILGFVPTIYNFCKMFFAHLEVYAWLYYNTCGKIYSDPDSRKASNLNMENAQVMSDFKVKEGPDSIVPPFPQVTSESQQKDAAIEPDINMDGTQETAQTTIDNKDGTRTVIEEDWLANISPNFEEINMIHGLLNGAKVIGEYMARHQEQGESSGETQEESSSNRECAVKYPVSPGDTVLVSSKESGPWGSIDQSDYSSFCGKVFIRMMQVLGYGGYEKYAATIGKIDARNFGEKVGISGVVADKMKGDHGFDEFLGIVTGGNENYLKDGRYAWEASSPSHYGIAVKNGSSYSLCTKLPNGDTVLPYEGVSYGEINSSLKPNNGNPPTYSLPNEFTKYALFGDTSIEGMEKTQNRNVFFIDRMYEQYSQYFSYKNDLEGEEKEFVNQISVGTDFSMELYMKDFYSSGKIEDFMSGTTDNIPNAVDGNKFKTIPAVKESDLSKTDDGCIFCSKVYARQSSMTSKAYVFLNALLDFSSKDKRKILSDITDKLLSNSQRFNIVPKYQILLLGGEIYMSSVGKGSFSGNLDLWEGASNTGLRKEVVDSLVAHFQTWSSGEFSEIDKTYGVAFKEEFYLNTKGVSGDDIAKFVVNSEEFKAKYKTDGKIGYDGGTASLKAEFAENVDFKPLAGIVFNPVMVVSCSSENRHGKSAKPSIDQSAMKAYWDAFTEEVKNATPAENATSLQDVIGGTATNCEAPEDLKVALYHHCKVFFDKWLAGSSLDDFDERWRLGSYFDKDDTRDGKFHFIDSFYNDVSNRVLVNPQIIMEDIMQSQSQDGYTLMSVLSDTLSKNRFMLFCIENFKNLLDDEMFQKSFRPVPYNQIKVKRQNSDIVAMYTYEPSSHLEEVDYNYPGDSFMLDHERMYPYAVSKKDLTFDYPLPAFGVTYGMQYQSFFTNIEVSMEKPMVTETSLKTQYLLAGASNDTTLTRQYVPYGQDLFSIYSNNAYTCDVTMMGCAWVQPLMYFCLTNVPMFRGSYLISKVSHKITPGKMETRFTGTRMANRATRLTTNWIKKGYMPDEFYERYGFSRYGGGNGTSCRTVPAESGSGEIVGGGEITANILSFMLSNEGWSDARKKGFIGTAFTDAKAGWQSQIDPPGVITVGPGLTNAMNGNLPDDLKIVDGKIYTVEQIGKIFARTVQSQISSMKKYCPQLFGWGQYAIDAGFDFAHSGIGHFKTYLGGAKNLQEFIDGLMHVTTVKGKQSSALVKRREGEQAIASGDVGKMPSAYLHPNEGCLAFYKAVVGGITSSSEVSSSSRPQQVCTPTASSDGGGEYGGASGGEVTNTPAVYGSVRQKIVQLCNQYANMRIAGGKGRLPKNNDQYIKNWHQKAGYNYRVGWCAIFAYNMLIEAGETTLSSTLKAMGAGYPPNFKKAMKQTTSPVPGDMVITDGDGDGQRHIGYIVEVNGNKIVEIGGNQSDGVTRWSGTFNGSVASLKEDKRPYHIYTSNY